MMAQQCLSKEQKQQLAILEPELRKLAQHGKYDEAYIVTVKIQAILRPTGNETRLMQAKNWLFQAALDDGRITTAQMGFNGIRQKTNRNTRVHLEATALEAICLLRKNDIQSAKPLIAEAIKKISVIKSDRRRLQFAQRMIERFDQEWTLAVLRQDIQNDFTSLDPAEIQKEANRLLRECTSDEIDEYAISGIPEKKLSHLYEAYDFARNRLPSADRRCLPSPEERSNTKEVSRTILNSTKRVIWRSLCDETSPVYKMWFEKGVMKLYDKAVLGLVITTALGQLKISYYTLAAALTAIVMKTGLEIFCDRFEPLALMIDQKDAS